MRKVVFAYDRLDVAYPSGDNSVKRTEMVVLDESQTMAKLIDAIDKAKGPHVSNFRVLGVATDEREGAGS